jgi:hypothetical protein
MAWPKGKKRPPETVAKIRATRAANRAARGGGASAAERSPKRTAGTWMRRPVTMTNIVPLDNGTEIRVDEQAPPPAHTVRGAKGVVEAFEIGSGEYRIRCGPRLVVRVPAPYVHAA